MDSYLIFGYLEDAGDDGTIAITSQLVLPAQRDAVLIRGFNAGHVPVLSTPDVLQFVEEILADKEAEPTVKKDKKKRRKKRR